MRVFVEGNGNLDFAAKTLIRLAKDNGWQNVVCRAMFFADVGREFAFRKQLQDGGIDFFSFELTKKLGAVNVAAIDFSGLSDLLDAILVGITGETVGPKVIITDAKVIKALPCWPATKEHVKPGTVCLVTAFDEAIQIIAPDD